MHDDHLPEAPITRAVIGAFFDVYNELGFGFLEHVYVMALEHELRSRGHDVARELAVRVLYKGRELATQRLDMVVDGRVVVEVKSTSTLHPSAARQLYNYLHSTHLRLGLLLHVGPRPAIHRLECHRHRASPPARQSSTDLSI